MTPSDEKTRQRYQGSQGEQYHQAKRSIPSEAIAWVAHLRAAKLQADVRPTDSVLEYGVGLGWNLAGLVCARKIGLDVGEFLKPLVQEQGIEFVSSPSAVADDSMDVVLCHHTLEHAWQPVALLAEIFRMLRPEGRLLLFVPYEKERRYRHFNPAEPNHHLYSWTVQTLGNLVADAGFTVQTAGLGRFGQERFAAVWASRCHLGERGFRLLHRLANSLKHGFEVRIVGQKPSSAAPEPGFTASPP